MLLGVADIVAVDERESVGEVLGVPDELEPAEKLDVGVGDVLGVTLALEVCVGVMDAVVLPVCVGDLVCVGLPLAVDVGLVDDDCESVDVAVKLPVGEAEALPVRLGVCDPVLDGEMLLLKDAVPQGDGLAEAVCGGEVLPVGLGVCDGVSVSDVVPLALGVAEGVGDKGNETAPNPLGVLEELAPCVAEGVGDGDGLSLSVMLGVPLSVPEGLGVAVGVGVGGKLAPKDIVALVVAESDGVTEGVGVLEGESDAEGEALLDCDGDGDELADGELLDDDEGLGSELGVPVPLGEGVGVSDGVNVGVTVGVGVGVGGAVRDALGLSVLLVEPVMVGVGVTLGVCDDESLEVPVCDELDPGDSVLVGVAVLLPVPEHVGVTVGVVDAVAVLLAHSEDDGDPDKDAHTDRVLHALAAPERETVTETDCVRVLRGDVEPQPLNVMDVVIVREVLGHALVEPERLSDGDALFTPDEVRETDAHAESDRVFDDSAVTMVSVTVGVAHADAAEERDGDSEFVTSGDTVLVLVSEAVAEGHALAESVAVPMSDADALGVDPAGAQNGPMLNVARCVPSMEKSGDAVLIDGELLRDALTVGTVGDAHPDPNSEDVREGEEHADTVPERLGDGVARAVGMVAVANIVCESVTEELVEAVEHRDGDGVVDAQREG